MDTSMVQEPRLTKLVHETLVNVMENAANSFDSEVITIRENTKENGNSDSEKGDTDLEEEEQLSFVHNTDLSVSDIEDDSESDFSLGGSDLARAHWIQLHKTNKQGAVVQHTFLSILSNYPHLRPQWHFGRNMEQNNEHWENRMQQDFYFRHHCASIQAAITMIMEHDDDSGIGRKVLNELGAHHFFYDAAEPHLECFHSSFMEALRVKCVGVNKMDKETEEAWDTLLTEMKLKIGEGIAIQRSNYMRMAITPSEIEQIRDEWEKVIEFGIEEAGAILCNEAFDEYKRLLEQSDLKLPLPKLHDDLDIYRSFCSMSFSAFDLTISCWSHNAGFLGLSDLLKDYVVTCMLLDVCPILLRKAVLHGLLCLLKKVHGEKHVTEIVRQIWSKLYRVLEQAIIANIVEY